MSCSRVCRELVWLARFGELGPSSAPHLEHLERCTRCRDEIGFDRALVQRLREALAERIAAEEPSPAAWGAIVERTRQPQSAERPTMRAWSIAALVGRLRVATAVTGTGLALILALNMEIVPAPLAPVEAQREPAATTELLQVPRAPVGRAAAVETPPAPARTIVPRDPEELMTLPDARVATLPATAPVTDEPTDVTPPVELRVVFRAHQSPEPAAAHAVSRGSGTLTPSAVRSEPGQPS